MSEKQTTINEDDEIPEYDNDDQEHDNVEVIVADVEVVEHAPLVFSEIRIQDGVSQETI